MIRPNFKPSQIRTLLVKKRENIRNAIILNMQRVGEAFIGNARDRGTYTDRTKNLRNSTGYLILENGVQLFLSTPGTGPGVQVARETLEKAKDRFPTGLVLIVVAGMDYAAAVESKGYDVISGSAPDAVAALKAAMKRISAKTANGPL